MRALFDIYALYWMKPVCCGCSIGEGDTVEAAAAHAIEKWKRFDPILNPSDLAMRYDYEGKPNYDTLSAVFRHEVHTKAVAPNT